MDTGPVIFPKNLDNLSSIFYIDIHTDLLVDLASAGNIPFLRAVGEFCVEKAKVQGLEILKDMNELQEFLVISSLENVNNKDKAANAQLANKSQISRLKLQWDSSNADSKSDKEYDVFNALRPHPGLKELTVDGYPGYKSPSWLEFNWLSRLEHINIHDCTCWKLLPPLGQLPCLKELHIDTMNALECIDTSFYGDVGFPSLETLQLTQLPELADWCSVDYAFPVLQVVFIRRCPKLKELPPVFPPPVKLKVLESIICMWHTDHRLDTCVTREICLTGLLDLRLHYLESMESADISFDGAGISNDGLRDRRHNLPKGPYIPGFSDSPSTFLRITGMEFISCPNLTLLPDFGCFPALQNLIINNCPELKELPEDGNLTTLTQVLIEHCNKLVSLRSLKNLSFLTKLEIRNCLKLVVLPEMVDFFSLRVMIIHNCPELVSLPEDGLPLTLNFLYLSGCHPLLEEQFEWQHGIEWEKYAMLPSCFYADKLMEDTEDIAEEVLRENDMIEWSIQTSLLHPTDSAASSSSFLQLPAAKYNAQKEVLVLLHDMDDFCSLRFLKIDQCRQLRSLPWSGLLVSLETFIFFSGKKVQTGTRSGEEIRAPNGIHHNPTELCGFRAEDQDVVNRFVVLVAKHTPRRVRQASLAASVDPLSSNDDEPQAT
uniref:R13L1/DRL21-like LRR repeat region domain-containing protein n=1 Tax=Oryza glumipatula TaxID=40148 RepID=A0A0E0ABY8_9ORYZ